MGVVVEFRIRDRRSTVQGADMPCEILLFTGVRYERHAEASGEPQPAGSKATPRGRGRVQRRPRSRHRA